MKAQTTRKETSKATKINAPVAYLSIEQAEELLSQDGIHESELHFFRHTVYASNASFWHHLYLLDRIGELTLRHGRIFSKPRKKIAVPA